MYSGYAIFSLVCALACFLIAKEKGKNPLVWFIGGLMLSGLALTVIALIRKQRSK